MKITFWPSLKDIDTHTQTDMSWEEVCQMFSHHIQVPAKLVAPGFGPYKVRPPEFPCAGHGTGRDGPHRCDTSVEAITLAVFDVDHGTETADGRKGWLRKEDLDACKAKLNEAGLAQHWYSSFSHSPNHLSYRLLLPLSEPILPQNWKSFRRELIRQFAIPTDPKKCAGLSHFYFVPATGEHTFQYREAETIPGKPVNVQSFIGAQIPRRLSLPGMNVTDADIRLTDASPIDLAPIRDDVIEKAFIWRRAVKHRRKGELLQKVINGEPLADKGSRDATTNQACSILAFTFPGHSLETYYRLIEQSLIAMQLDGSKLTPEKVKSMLKRAMLARASEEKRRRVILDAAKAQTKEMLANASRI